MVRKQVKILGARFASDTSFNKAIQDIQGQVNDFLVMDKDQSVEAINYITGQCGNQDYLLAIVKYDAELPDA